MYNLLLALAKAANNAARFRRLGRSWVRRLGVEVKHAIQTFCHRSDLKLREREREREYYPHLAKVGESRAGPQVSDGTWDRRTSDRHNPARSSGLPQHHCWLHLNCRALCLRHNSLTFD